MIRTYSELMMIPTFEERYEYLKLTGIVGEMTFGDKRQLNQLLYTSPEWRSLRNSIIVRDNGCDLAIPGREIFKYITVHHINPITIEDVIRRSSRVFDTENLITTSDITHKAIHYGDKHLLMKDPVARQANDTCPWKK